MIGTTLFVQFQACFFFLFFNPARVWVAGLVEDNWYNVGGVDHRHGVYNA